MPQHLKLAGYSGKSSPSMSQLLHEGGCGLRVGTLRSRAGAEYSERVHNHFSLDLIHCFLRNIQKIEAFLGVNLLVIQPETLALSSPSGHRNH